MPDSTRLLDQDRPVLYALALHQGPLTRGTLQELLRLAGPRIGGSGVPSGERLRESISRLLHGWLRQTDDLPSYAIEPQAHMSALLLLQQSGAMPTWVSVVQEWMRLRGDYRQWRGYGGQFARREVIFAAMLDQFADMIEWHERLVAIVDYDSSRLTDAFFANDDGLTLFASFSPRVQGMMISDTLMRNEWGPENCQAVYQYAQAGWERIGKGSPLFSERLAWQALLRGDLERMAFFLDSIPPQARFPFLLAEACLRGRFAFALDLILGWRTVHKEETGKRPDFIEDHTGLLYTVALFGQYYALRGGAVASPVASAGAASKATPNEILKLARQQIEAGVKTRHAEAYFHWQLLLNHLQHGAPLSRPVFGFAMHDDIDMLYSALARYWQDGAADAPLLLHMQALRAKWLEYGYQWLAAELDALLVQQGSGPALLPGWHAQRKLQPLVLAVPREASWQRALNLLVQLKPGAVPEAGELKEMRLLWLLEPQREQLKLAVLEQKKSAKGVWSKGRTMTFKRLMQEQDGMAWLSEQDQKLLGCIEKFHSGFYGGLDYVLPIEKGLPQLIGHPAVCWADAPEARVEVVKGEVALQLQQQGEQISLQLEPPLLPEQTVLWRKQTLTRLVVYPVGPELRQIAAIIGQGLLVPGSAKPQLVQAIAAIAPHLVILSDLPELTAHMASVPADPTLYAHLLPLEHGLRLQFLVRPLPEGAWFSPGKGSINVLGEQNGNAVQASRQLEQERARHEAVQAACPSLQLAEPDGNHWQFGQPETCLELLSELKALPPEQVQLVWPEGERFRLREQVSLSSMRLGLRHERGWLVADGEIKLDNGRVLALRDLLKLTEQAAGRFIKLGENDYLALSEVFRKRLLELATLGDLSGKDGVRLPPLAAPALMEWSEQVGELKADAAWRAQVQKIEALAHFAPQVPTTLQAELRDYQIEGYQWLARLAEWGVGACLADDMGLGKTVQTLALLLARATGGPALVVAPVSVAMNWVAEVARFAPTLRVRLWQRERNLADLGPFDLVITSYGLLQQDAELFAGQHWHSVVLDEAQVIKNAATKRSQAAMALNADFKMIASGTPVENHLGELWNLFRFINPGLLGSKEQFSQRFAGPVERGSKVVRAHLKKLIQPFILRRTKTQVLSELPEKTEITLQVTLSDQERHLYEALRQQALANLSELKPGEGIKTIHVLAEITKLRRFCCNPALVMGNLATPSSKLAVLAEVVEELLANRHKVLVFSQFVDHLTIVREWLDQKQIHYQYLDGSTAPQERKKRVDAFQAGQGDIFLISLKAGGTGLNLTAADYVIHLDPWWNPAVEDQASDRAHRIGQQRPVTIYRLVTEGTIEQKIIALHAEKRDLADSLLEGGDMAGKLDTAALLGLLKESL
jgi:hypothetical protein